MLANYQILLANIKVKTLLILKMTSDMLAQVFERLRFIGAVKNQSDFGEKMGWGRAFTSQVISGTRVPPKGIESKLAEAFPDVTIPEIVSHQVVEEPQVPYSRFQQTKQAKKGPRTPFFDAEADAGDADGDMLPVSAPSGYIDTGDLFGPCEAAIRIRGNSMLKAYPSGTILGLNKHYDSFIQPGELYVLETRSQRIFKRLFDCEGERKDCFECYSDNDGVYKEGPRAGKPFYPVFYVPKEEVLRTWAVVGSARPHGNSLIIHANP